MKRLVLKVFFVIVITISLSGCNNDENDVGKGEGVLKINENEYPITNAYMYLGGATSYST